MNYLLDTCTISDLIRGWPGVLAKFQAMSASQLAISSISQMELDYGLALAPATAQRIAPSIHNLLHPLATLSFDQDDAKAAGLLRAALRKQGTPIGPYDVLIAGCAIARNRILVTSNTREFGRVAGLQLENWR